MLRIPALRTALRAGGAICAVVVLAYTIGCTQSDSLNAPAGSREGPRMSQPSTPDDTTVDLVTYEDTKDGSDMESDSRTVSARSGGSLQAGSARLDIPKGALASDTRITLSMSNGTAAEYQIEPTGLEFLVPVTLTLDYKDTSADPSSSNYDPTGAARTSVAWFDPSASVWTNIGGTDDTSHQWVCINLSHLSYYALSK